MLNNVVQENAATAEEMAAGSEELNAQAESLQEAISFFNIGEDTIRHNTPKSSNSVRPVVSNPKSSQKIENK